MKKFFARFLFVALLLGVTFPTLFASAQTGTLHGVLVSWVAPPAGSDPAVGYFVYRCSGTCTTSSTGWVQIDTVADLNVNYVDAASGLAAGTTYSYAAVVVDSTGDQSAFSNIATVTTPSTWAVNPGSPTGCNAKVQ